MLSTPTPAGKANHDDFAARIVAWQHSHGRHDLPWQSGRDPYRIWLAEIMLQQTQVATVVPYYLRFVERFADVQSLAAASPQDVMAVWSGLGYYARARNLHRAAQIVASTHGGSFPVDAARLAELPGIGRSTAAAIAAFAAGQRVAILDGNVKRVLARHFAVAGFPGRRDIELKLWTLAESLLPPKPAMMAAYTQGLMDLGATLCLRRRPDCTRCPLAGSCIARRDRRTAELPTPRPPRASPQRECTLLVIRESDRVLLEIRPPLGIWGGLASLPELEAGGDIAGAVARLCGSHPLELCELEPLAHAFTHFRLKLKPVLARVVPPFTLARQAGDHWLALDALDTAPLPAPVRRLLARLPAS